MNICVYIARSRGVLSLNIKILLHCAMITSLGADGWEHQTGVQLQGESRMGQCCWGTVGQAGPGDGYYTVAISLEVPHLLFTKHIDILTSR